MGKQHFAANLTAIVAASLMLGCSKPVTDSLPESINPMLLRGVDSVELPRDQIHVSWLERRPEEKDVTDALGLTVYNFKFELPDNMSALWLKIELTSKGKPARTLFAQSLDRGMLQPLPDRFKTFPCFLTINPADNLRGEGIYGSKGLRFFLKTPVVQSQLSVRNPFYKSTNGISTYGPYSAGVVSNPAKLMSGGDQELVMSFQLFVTGDKGAAGNATNSITPAKPN